ncbi:hypothetical protein [Nocardia abscessus]|uniref:hypothetical protein n=1 Tax=Nocardia abscessus TaxID=120957 RepID=UPI0024576924|nr:hypothetical protein [Nocardia abscessus]
MEEQVELIHSMRTDADRECLQGRWDLSDDIEQHKRLFGSSPIPNPFPQAEFRRPEPEPFETVWARLEPWLAGKFLTAYNASYDQTWIDQLVLAARGDTRSRALRWIDGLAVARHYQYWAHPYDLPESPPEQLLHELFPIDRREGWDGEHSWPGAKLQDVVVRLELIGSDEARTRAIAHREWGLGNKPLLRDAADDAWANAGVIATALRAEGLPVTAEGLTILDALIVDPDPAGPPAHQHHLASLHPVDPVCARFLETRAQAELKRCLTRMSGIRLSPEEWSMVYDVWESAARWLMRLANVVEPELSPRLGAEAAGPIQAALSVLRCHQRGRVYADALWCWLEANRRQLAFQGNTDDEIEAKLSQLRADEEEDRVLRRRRGSHGSLSRRSTQQ